MKTIKYLSYIVLGTFVLSLASCEPRALTEEQVVTAASDLDAQLAAENPEGYDFYTLEGFLDAFMTEQGNFMSDSSIYRTRTTNGNGLYMFSIDTLPTNGRGIYIRGRVTTDDYAGNFYKSMAIQQIVDGKQQNLRISVDLGSSGGLFQLGQEIVIRCNGLAVGRYSNQPQLCVPSYTNNIYAMNASQKVGWAPGRIPAAAFRKAARMIGYPNPKALKYDTLTLAELFTDLPFKPTIDSAGMRKVRYADSRLVTITGVHFTGQYDDNGSIKDCNTQHPDSSGGACVFAPTTKNIGYPQSRIIADGSNKLMCASSEYAKFAYYYIPGASSAGIGDCANWTGSVTGILGWYQDNAANLTTAKLDGYEWSVTPRGIPGIGVADLRFKNAEGVEWIPTEYDPKANTSTTAE